MPVSFFPSAEQADEKPANKRRRKQNDEIGELGELLPFQGVGGKSLDKLSILRLSTSYIRFQNFMTVAYGENGAHKENVLTNLIDQAMDGFLMVIASDGVILYASDNMESFVALGPRDVIGHSLHDLVQSEQDSNTITKNLEPKGNQLNQHRMFYIRLRNAVTPGRVKVSRYNTNLSLQLNGHLKVVRDHSLNITFSKLSPELADDLDLHDKMVPQRPHVLGLVVECRPIEAVPSILELDVPQVSFTSTVGMDMKIQSVDTQVTEILGFDPKDFIGSTMKDYFHPSDFARLLPCKMLLQRTGYACSPMFRFMTASGDWAWIQLEGTMRFDKETRKPKHMETIIKIVSQSEGTLKYIEQKEFYSHGRTNNSIVSLHPDPYDSFVPEKPVRQSHEPIVAGLQEASVAKQTIDAVLHGRELGLSALPSLLTDVVSSAEEAERLEYENKKRFSKIDFSKFQEGEKIHPMCIMHMLKEMKEMKDEEELAQSQCAPSPAPSSVSQISSVPSAMTPVSGVSDSHIPSPHSVPLSGTQSVPSMAPSPQSSLGFVPSPHSASGLVPSPQSSTGLIPSPHSVMGPIPSPHSASSLVPSPQSVYSMAASPQYAPPSVLYSMFETTASPDSGIDSPTSAGSDSASSFQSHSQITNIHVSMLPVSQSFVPIPASYQFQPQTANIPSAFNFTTQQQQQQQQIELPPVSMAGSISDNTLEMLLTAATPQQQQHHHQQQHPPHPPSQEWVERQRQLEDQIQRQRELLQDLIVQQKFLQAQLPAGKQQQQPVYNHVENGSFPTPMSSVSGPNHQTLQNFSQYQTLPPHVTNNSGQNGLNHAISGITANISFLGSVDLLSNGGVENLPSLPPPPPSPNTIEDLFQQLQ